MTVWIYEICLIAKRPFREKAGGRYAVGFFFRLRPGTSGSAESVKVLISGSPAPMSAISNLRRRSSSLSFSAAFMGCSRRATPLIPRAQDRLNI